MVKTCKIKDRACISIIIFYSTVWMLGLSLSFSQGYSHNALKKCLGKSVYTQIHSYENNSTICLFVHQISTT